MEYVYIKSREKGIIAKRIKPSFKYYFGDKPVKVLKEHADILVRNPNYSIIKKEVGEVTPDLDRMSIKELRDFATKKGLKAKDTDTKELREEIKKELEGGN